MDIKPNAPISACVISYVNDAGDSSSLSFTTELETSQFNHSRGLSQHVRYLTSTKVMVYTVFNGFTDRERK